MKKEDIINKLNKVASKETSGWLEKAKEREANKDWLAKSAKIAIKILREFEHSDLLETTVEIEQKKRIINQILKM